MPALHRLGDPRAPTELGALAVTEALRCTLHAFSLTFLVFMQADITVLLSSASERLADDQAVYSRLTSAEGRDTQPTTRDNQYYIVFVSHGSGFVADSLAWNCRYTTAIHLGARLVPTCTSHFVTDTQTHAHIFPLLPHSHNPRSRSVSLQPQCSTGSAPRNCHRLTTYAIHRIRTQDWA